MPKNPMTRTQMKEDAQNTLMHGIGNMLGYFEEVYAPIGWADWTAAQQDEYRLVMRREADRVAKLFGFDKAWTN
ncbi:hypothetical protein ACFWM7_01555 [Streptomyces sp. NPDC058375]|uniref:hypothetical protein n=1 Tax=Streptomyces sp. NPDC058375 TaxID=3346467 RepID=UPI0036650356